MNTRRLEAFLAIVRCGSFAAAAAQLNMTQSAVSLRIRELERDLGVTIFDRKKRKVVLTESGRALVDHATTVTSAVNDMKYVLGQDAQVSGTVRLGIAELVAVTWLPILVNELQRRFPRLQLQLEVGLADNLGESARRGEIDIALMPGTKFSWELESVSLGSVDFQWMAAPSIVTPDWNWNLSAPTAPRILLLPENSFINSIADAWFRQNNIMLRRTNICNSMSVLASLTAAGLGISLLPTFCYSEELANGTFQLVDPRIRINGTFYAVFRRSSLTATARTLAAICQEISTFPRGAGRSLPVNYEEK